MRLPFVICVLVTASLMPALLIESSPKSPRVERLPRSPALKDLYDNKQYFELRDSFRNSHSDGSAERLFYRGAVSNKFNRSQASIADLNQFLKLTRDRERSSLSIECYELLADNYRKTFQYRRAAETYNTLLTRFRGQADEKSREDYENEVKLWGALQNVMPQTTTFRADTIINKDQDGRIPLRINGQQQALAFDTGANLSVIRDTIAKKLGLKLVNASIDVGAVSGLKVKANLAVARRIEIGNAIIRNAVFLVFEDKDLYIPDANLQLDGVVGFPVIAALREMTFVRDGQLRIPARPSKRGEQNMALDGLTPLIAGWFKGQRLIFAFDTGASASTLYPTFFKKFEANIKAKYDSHLEKVRGVGGYREIKGYLGRDIAIIFAGKEARYPTIPILTEHTTENSRHFYGNLGQDLVKQFKKMTLNFTAMSIVFE